jgi:hypothetical protein
MAFVLSNSVVTGMYFPDQASAYSAAIAMRHGLPIATQDQQLKSAAMTAGVVVL